MSEQQKHYKCQQQVRIVRRIDFEVKGSLNHGPIISKALEAIRPYKT